MSKGSSLVTIRIPVRRYTPPLGNVSQNISLTSYFLDLEQNPCLASKNATPYQEKCFQVQALSKTI